MTAEKAIQTIEQLYPPDSQFTEVATLGRVIMYDTVGNSVNYKNWRDLDPCHLTALAKANLAQAREELSQYGQSAQGETQKPPISAYPWNEGFGTKYSNPAHLPKMTPVGGQGFKPEQGQDGQQ
jgi:hypothetical protein